MRNSQGGCPGLPCSAPLGQRITNARPKRQTLDVALFSVSTPRRRATGQGNAVGSGRRRDERAPPQGPRQNQHNRQSYPVLHMSLRAPALWKWRPARVGRARRSPRHAECVSVRSGRRACCNRPQPARSTAKWRFGPRKSAISVSFSTIFSLFFREFRHEGAVGRECALEMCFP
jgi:hypothetical protein